MGARGPKPKPSALKKRDGTYKKCKQAPSEYSPDQIETLAKPPTWLNKYAKDEYLKVGAVLLKDGLLATIDMNLFITYCQQMGIFIESQHVLKKEGRVVKTKSGYSQPHPYVAIGNSAHQIAIKIAASFGITPSARTRVSAEKKAIDEKPKDGILRLVPKKVSSNG